ncbi:MAG: carboxylesterase/lipase family protein [Oceanicaulis sp.]
MIRRFIAIAAFGALALAACAEDPDAPAPVADADLGRTVTGGRIVGYVDADTGAHVWLGVPFAAAPDGANRWRAPQPVEPWRGARETLAHAEPCPQITNALNAEATGTEPGQLIGTEDCLFLDVYAPPREAAGDGPPPASGQAQVYEPGRPVLIWIHGGGNVWGSDEQYDGAQLATDQDAIVVVVQYRLGPLGFFAHPALTADAPEMMAGDSAPNRTGAANFALLDLVAALKWVQENAAAFGGDAERVTIFGESAGGHNVAALMASPPAEGLFHRAIIQSGSFESVPLDEARSGADYAAVQAAERFAGADPDAAALRAAPLSAVYDAYARDGLMSGLPRMIADGVTVPEGGLEAAFEAGDFHRVPVITGANRDEMKLFNLLDPALTDRLFGAIIRTPDPELYDAASEYQSRLWRALAVDDAASAMTAAGHEDVWAYRFDWDEGGTMLFMDMSRLLGAAHAMEIPFVFDHFEFFGRLDPALFNGSNADGRAALADSMGAYWARFARTGDPDAAGGPDWPSWTDTGVLMRFDSPEDGGPELITGVETVERIAADLAADERLTAYQKCLVLERLTSWRDTVRTLAAPLIDCEA